MSVADTAPTLSVVYGIALSASACLRGGTRVDVAWNLDPQLTPGHDPTDAVAITPGGGRLGGLLDGAIDSRLIELSLAEPTEARVLTVELDALESSTIGVDPGTTIRVLFAPTHTLPEQIWGRLLARQPVSLGLALDGDRVIGSSLGDTPVSTHVVVEADRAICEWAPTTALIVFGGGPMADALQQAATFAGWNVERTGGVEAAIARATSLSSNDGIVVMGHDTEAVGRVLHAALASGAGYIGSLGPARLQDDRRDWLAYRGVTDTSDINAPAGFDIGATTPEHVAVSIVAEMIAVLNTASTDA